MYTGILGDGWRLWSTMSSIGFDVLSRRFSVLHVTVLLNCERYSDPWLMLVCPMVVESSARLFMLTNIRIVSFELVSEEEEPSVLRDREDIVYSSP